MPSYAGAGGRDCKWHAWMRNGKLHARALTAARPAGRLSRRVAPLLQGPGKKWEHTETNANGKPVRVSMHVRKGDTVKVRLAGPEHMRPVGSLGRVPSLCFHGASCLCVCAACTGMAAQGARRPIIHPHCSVARR